MYYVIRALTYRARSSESGRFIDALFFHLYGLSRDDAAYILDTFPIVREYDEKAFGRYLTKELVLAYWNAVEAGDLTTVVRI